LPCIRRLFLIIEDIADNKRTLQKKEVLSEDCQEQSRQNLDRSIHLSLLMRTYFKRGENKMKEKISRRKFLQGAAMATAATMLAACSPSATTVPTNAPVTQPTTPPTKAPLYTIDYYQVGTGDSDDRANVEAAINAYIEPLINAHVIFHIVPWADWQGKAVTALQAGEKMDIFFTADWSYYAQEVTQGLLTPMNDDKGANGNLLKQYGQKIISSLNPAFLAGSAINGINYAIPTNKELCVPWGYVYNAAVADEIGFKDSDAAAIKSMADIEPWLVKVKAAHSNMFPYLTDGSLAFLQWQHGFNNLSDYVVNMSAIPDASGKVDETILNPIETPFMKDYVTTMHSWMQKGYIDPNAGLDTFNTSDYLNPGKFFIETMPLKGNGAKASELMIGSGNPDLKLKEIYVTPKVVNTSDAGGSMLAIPASSKNPVAAMQYINLMHSDATLINMMLYGVPNTDWTVDADGRVNVSAKNTWVTAIPGAWVMGDITLQKVTNKEDPKKNQLLIDYAKDATPMPSLGFRFDQTPVNAEFTAVQTAKTNEERALLTGSVDPTTALPTYIADLKSAGLDKILAEYQKQYAAWKKAKGG
jgi:putative aldouronate transport system substrate-binding protein